jgi:hypothetical protein
MGRTACTEPHCLYKGDLYLLPQNFRRQKGDEANSMLGTNMYKTSPSSPLGHLVLGNFAPSGRDISVLFLYLTMFFRQSLKVTRGDKVSSILN